MAFPVPSRSPLDSVFAGHAQIPFAFSEQFLHSDQRPYGVRLEGMMHRIWHRPAALGPLFWFLGKLGILVPHNALDIPTTLVVRPGQNSTHGLYHVWDRTFSFSKPIRFRTTIIYDAGLGEVVDLVGPGNVLYMVWNAQFHPPDRFTLDTNSCALRIGTKKLWMPRWLWRFLLGTVEFSQVANSADGDLMRVDLLIRHPVFGPICGYDGSFRIIRTEKAPEAVSQDTTALN